MCNCALLSVAPPTTPGPWLAVQCASAALDCDTRIIQRQTRMDKISEEVVVLVQRDKAVRPLKLKKGRKLHLDRLSFCADGALGHCYGSCFQVDKQHLVPLNEDRKQGVLVEDEGVSAGGGNRNIFDDGSSQELTEQDISHMKGQGASGLEIVESMIEHSSSFKERSKFSQEKYIRKKEKKYIPVIKILRTTMKLLCDYYHERAPAKICHMRSDTLAQILTLSNVHALSNLVVMETCQGLIVGSMLERMGGYGKLVQVFYGDFPVRMVLDNFGHLTDSDRGILMKYPLHRVGSCLLTKDEQCASSILTDMLSSVKDESQCVSRGEVDEDSECKTLQPKEESTETSSPPPAKKLRIENESSEQQEHDMQTGQDGGQLTVEHECHPPPVLEDSEKSSNVYVSEGASSLEVTTAESGSELRLEVKGRKERKLLKEEAYKQAEELLQQRKMDGLVIACRFLPEPILMSLVNLIAPSRPIVVYCHLLEPLVQCYKSLKKSGMAFNIQITDTWLRHYQVLPERTHPVMSMDGHSGYLLTATKIKKDTV